MITIVFTSSLFLISAMISLKLIEERKRRKFLFSDLREGADKASLRIVNKIKKYFLLLKTKDGKTPIAFIGRLVIFGVSSVKRKISLRKIKFMQSLKVGGNLKKKGPASFFLKNVSEYKIEYIKRKENLY